MVSKNICVIGNLITDLKVYNINSMPNWGEEVVGDKHEFCSGGQAFTLACGLSKLGLNTSVISSVGSDHFGRNIINDLHSLNVDTSKIDMLVNKPTGVSVSIIRGDGERSFISSFGSLTLFNVNSILQHWQFIIDSDVICFVGTFNFPNLSLVSLYPLFMNLQDAGKLIIFDPGWDPSGWSLNSRIELKNLLPFVDTFLPNLDEAQALTGFLDKNLIVKDLRLSSCSEFVIKCGADGSLGYSGLLEESTKVKALKIFDAVGAGDIFNAGFLYAKLNDYSLADCLIFANFTASFFLTRENQKFPTVHEVLALVDKS